MRFSGYACLEPKAQLVPFGYAAGPLGSHEVEVAITYCGICFSDVHLVDDDWKRSRYPFIPGHEIVGHVAAIGSELGSAFRVGQRVGIGWQRSACLECEFCREGNENLCARQEAVCVGHHGGFADRIRCDGRFVFPIPDGLPSAAAAPLMCGGATVFSPIKRFGVGPGSRVGVIGIGGLGHMALLFLKALDCETTAFSSSEGKRSEAEAMGAHHFVSSTNPRDVLAQANRFDLILSTVHARVDWVSFAQALRPNGTLCLVGAPPGLIQIPPGILVSAQKSVCGSDIASPRTIREMLEFSAKHRILPQVEILPMRQANQGIEKLRKNQVRYRVVLENAST